MTFLSGDSDQPEVQVCTGVTFSRTVLLLVGHLSLSMDSNYINLTAVTDSWPYLDV